jgi:hypothetical protein
MGKFYAKPVVENIRIWKRGKTHLVWKIMKNFLEEIAFEMDLE